MPEDDLAAAHRRLDEVLPGSGPLAERLIAWRESHAVPVDKLDGAIHSLADDFRERTDALFGLPDGEHIDFVLETDKPWSGFNYYLGGLRSRVAINVDLPVLSTSLGHLVAHEAYPGHHTEHTRKEVGLVRRRDQQEEAIFLVGTPAVPAGRGSGRPRARGARRPPARSRCWPSTSVRSASATTPRSSPPWPPRPRRSPRCGATSPCSSTTTVPTPMTAIAYLERWALLPRNRAEKTVEFLTDPTWRAYISCYVEGLPLCRRFVAGDPARFQRLLSEQLIPVRPGRLRFRSLNDPGGARSPVPSKNRVGRQRRRSP